MAKAFECDGCGALIKHRTRVTASCKLPNGKTFYAFVNFAKGEKGNDREKPDLCTVCSRNILKNTAILDEIEVVTREGL